MTDTEYQERIVTDFLAGHCVVGPNARVAKGEFYRRYRTWCVANDRRAESQRGLSHYMSRRGMASGVTTGGLRLWLGVGLIDGARDG